MKLLDRRYLLSQFITKVHTKNGTEFQSFFEKIMEKAFLDFQKIRPYGNEGDGGNDGYRKALGIYYQVYAPNEPKINEADAARKFQNNFYRLKKEWDEISNIKEYNFVFNDKYGGSVRLLERKISELERANPEIKFKLFLSKDLENIFIGLSEPDIQDLDFDVSQRQTVSIVQASLDHVKVEFDKEDAIFAQKLLENIKDAIQGMDDEFLSLEYEILECRCLQKFERVDEAKARYKNISKRFPKDSRSLLYLAEIYLNENNYDVNKELLEKAENIDEDYWLLKLERVLRKSHLQEHIELADINEQTFPDVKNIKASFYRVYGLILHDLGDNQRAESFVEKAIHLNPDRFSNYVAKLALVEIELLSSRDDAHRLKISQELMVEIEKVEDRFLKHGNIGARNKAILNSKKLNALLGQENISGFENLAKETFELLLTCYFDKQVERILIGILQYVSLPSNDLDRLLVYLKNSKNEISTNLSETLIVQFNLWSNLLTDGKKFFGEINSQRYLEFINDLESKDYDRLLVFLKQNIQFATAFANTLKSIPDLRRKIIEELPDDENIQKEKLWLLLNFDKKDYEEAFHILQQLDLSRLNFVESRSVLQIAQQKQAWDFEIILLEKLLKQEKNKRDIFNLKIQLLNAYLNSKKFLAAINIGEDLLREDATENFYNPRRQEGLLWNTIYSCLERGKVDANAYNRAKAILDFYQLINPSLEFKAGVEAEVYISNNEAENALKSVVDGAKIKKLLSSHEYAKLYFLFVRIGNQIEDLNTESLNKVQDDTFVKLTDKDQWYFIGDKHELDATPISKTNNKYSLFIDKELGEKIVFENKYGSKNFESEIQLIFTIEKYILWQVVQNFQMLAKEGDLEGVQMIEIPQKEDAIDPQFILRFMEDLNKRTEPLFDLYCKNNVPLAMLVVSEGSLPSAIGRIQNEDKGFINFSVGTLDELEKQKETARKIIDENGQFYIDGTSALVLSEIGLLQKIYKYLPNLKVPQSVIDMLAEIANRFRYIPGQTGDTMGYSKGKITLSSIGHDKRELLQENFQSSVKLLEANPENVDVISSANKLDCFSETQVPDELSDACILAQKGNVPVLTDDYLYLKLNESETKKQSPEYFSSWALVRVLYEKGYVTFDEYLEYFRYLSSYRFRFLSLSPDDIQKAVFGDKDKRRIEPKNIQRLNLPFVLSEEYGVSFDDALRVVGIFFFRVIMDNTIRVDTIDEIFIEITESFPAKASKKEFGERLLGVCKTAFENNAPERLCRLEDKLKYQKIERLLKTAETLSAEAKKITTNE